jgi:hypothetical protein
MNQQRRLVALSVNTLVIGLLLAGCGDYSDSDEESATGGSTGVGGDTSDTGTGGDTTGVGGDGGDTGTGGDTTGVGGDATGTGGMQSGTGGGPATCTNVTPCGGELVGTWNVTWSCLTVSGELDPATVALSCSTALVTGGAIQVTGSLTANSDGTYSDNTVTSGTTEFTLDESCLVLSSTRIACDQAARVVVDLGFSDVSCTETADGGCSCSGTVQQTGGLGLSGLYPSASGTYTTSGNVLTATDLDTRYETQYSHCVSESTLTMTPQSTSPTITGTVVLQKQ